VAIAVNELFASACVLRRLECEHGENHNGEARSKTAPAERFLQQSAKRIATALQTSQELANA
jgi:hypothetical protein